MRTCTFKVILLFSLFVALHSYSQNSQVREYQVKGAMLYKFGLFTYWPPRPSREPSEPLSICIYGKDPFGNELDEALKNRTIQGHPIIISRIQSVDELSPCSILFIGTKDQSILRSVLKTAQDMPVLTVGEAEDFTKLGGVIRLYQQNQSIHFEVNIDAMNRSGIALSSKVLALARLYKEKS